MLQHPFFRATATATATDRRGRTVIRSATRISHDSPEDARRLAEADARRVAQEAAEGKVSDQRYAYGDRLLIEPVLERIGIPGTPGGAFITINGYGSEVLNAEQLMFVDVDLPEPRTHGFLDRLFGRKPPPDPNGEALDRLAALVAQQPGIRVRTYRTAAGLRYIFCHRPHDPAAPDTAAVMTQLGADPKFALLCRVQKSFRARLSPKPWRCGIHAEHPRFAGSTEEPGENYLEWRDRYRTAAGSYATCRFIDEFGDGPSDPALKELVALHDRETRSESALPLA